MLFKKRGEGLSSWILKESLGAHFENFNIFFKFRAKSLSEESEMLEKDIMFIVVNLALDVYK